MGNIATAISRRPAALSGQHDVLVVGDDATEVRQLAAQVVAPSQLLLGGRRQVGQHEDALSMRTVMTSSMTRTNSRSEASSSARISAPPLPSSLGPLR